MKCKRCQHEDYSHIGGVGKCQVELPAYTQEIEYDVQCSCEYFTLEKQTKKPKRRSLMQMPIDQYIEGPISHKETHNHYPL